jgi:histidinol-phosphate aminotransferase
MTKFNIARPEVAALHKVATGPQDPDAIRLNANEAPETHWFADDEQALNRYPEARPTVLRAELAKLYSVSEDHLLVTRGSSEAIDVVIRTFCRAYQDSVVSMPPTFELYPYFARIQGAESIEVPLHDETFAVDCASILHACKDDTKVIFFCSPNNPTGSVVDARDILSVADARRGKSVVVVDEAYIEFSEQASLTSVATTHENLIVLRTLSKAYALAGARCGVAISNREIIDIASGVLSPFSFAAPSADCVLQALAPNRMAAAKQYVEEAIAERDRLSKALGDFESVEKVWPTDGNFLLLRVSRQQAILDSLRDRRILIRGYGEHQGLKDCLRITVGTPAENDALLNALKDFDTQIG